MIHSEYETSLTKLLEKGESMKKCLIMLMIVLNLISLSANALIELDFGNTKYIAAVLKVDDQIEVWINTRAHWNEEGCLIDSYSSEDQKEIDEIKDIVGLCGLQESVYEPCRSGQSQDDITLLLMSAGVEIDSDFQAWAQKEILGQ